MDFDHAKADRVSCSASEDVMASTTYSLERQLADRARAGTDSDGRPCAGRVCERLKPRPGEAREPSAATSSAVTCSSIAAETCSSGEADAVISDEDTSAGELLAQCCTSDRL